MGQLPASSSTNIAVLCHLQCQDRAAFQVFHRAQSCWFRHWYDNRHGCPELFHTGPPYCDHHLLLLLYEYCKEISWS